MSSKRQYVVIKGSVELLNDRTVTVNGVVVTVPKVGQAHIGIELRLQDSMLVLCVRELKGRGGTRFGFFHIGNDELTTIKGMLNQQQPTELPFVFTVDYKRPKITVN